jgi:anti-sigma factor RsiW
MSASERPYITCRELIDFLYLYLEGELPEDRQVEFERHLAVCTPCREYIHQYQESIKLGKAALGSAGGARRVDAGRARPGDSEDPPKRISGV